MAENPIRKEDIIDAEGIIKSMLDIVGVIKSQLLPAIGSINKTITEEKEAVEKLNPVLKEHQTILAQKGTTINSLEQVQKKNKQTLTETERLEKRLLELRKDSAIQNEKLRQSIQKQTKENKNLVATEGLHEKSLARLRVELSRLKVQYAKVSPEIAQKMAPAIKKLNKSILESEKAIGVHQRNVGNYTNAMSALPGPVGMAASRVNMLSSAFKALLANPIVLVIAAVAAAFVGLVKVFKSSTKVASEFEEEFTNVLTLLDKAQKLQYRDILEKGTIELISKYGFTIEETNKALFDYISATGDAAGAVDFLNEAAVVAIGGNSTLSAVIDGATNIIGAYGSKAGSTTDILNSFFAAQVKGKTTVQELAENIGKTASAASAAGISTTELFGVFASLTKFLGGTEESATAMANVINALIKPTTEAKGIFKSLGIETGITAVKQEGLLNKLLQVAAAYEGNADILTDLIPNIRAFRGIAGLTSEAIAEIEKNVEDLNDQELSLMLVQDAFNEKMETSDRKGKVAAGTWKELMIEIGGGESVFKRVGDSFKDNWTQSLNIVIEKIRTFKVEYQTFLDLFRKEENKKADDLIKKYVGVNDEIVEDEKDTTIELTEEEKKRQAILAEIRRRASELKQSEEEKALQKAQEARTKAATAAIEKIIKKDTEGRNKWIQSENDKIKFAQETSNELVEIKHEEIQLTQAAIDANAEYEKQVNREIAADKAEAFIEDANKYLEIASSLNNQLADIFRQRKEKELSAVGDNAEAREKIEREYANKEKIFAITTALIQNALNVMKALGTPPVPNIPLAAITGALGLVQIGLIASQKFAEGGEIEGRPHSRGGELIEAEGGEFMINKLSTSKYKGLIKAINEDDKMAIAEELRNRNFHLVWGGANEQLKSSARQDPYTRMMYELMRQNITTYIDSNGDTNLVYPNGYRRIIKTFRA